MAIDDMTDDDIAASTEAHDRGETPKAKLSEIAQLRRAEDPLISRTATRPAVIDSAAPLADYGDPAIILRGEQHDAHVALQAAAKALKDAQAKVAEAQAVFRGCLERWCKSH